MAEDATKKTQAEQRKTLTEEELDKVTGAGVTIQGMFDVFKSHQKDLYACEAQLRGYQDEYQKLSATLAQTTIPVECTRLEKQLAVVSKQIAGAQSQIAAISATVDKELKRL